MRRLLVLGLLALLPACAVDIDDPESEDIGSENSELVQGEAVGPSVAPEAVSSGDEDPQVTSPTTQGPTTGPTPDPWTGGAPAPDPWVIPIDSETQKKTAH